MQADVGTQRSMQLSPSPRQAPSSRSRRGGKVSPTPAGIATLFCWSALDIMTGSLVSFQDGSC